jgi:hypothetical protein
MGAREERCRRKLSCLLCGVEKTERASAICRFSPYGNRNAWTTIEDEIAARLEVAEARTETLFAHLYGSLDVRFGDLGHKIDQITNSMNGLVSAVQEVKADNKATRITIIVTVVASVLAGLAAIWSRSSSAPKPLEERACDMDVVAAIH